MTEDQAAFLLKVHGAAVETEYPVTRKVIAAIPETKHDYRPDPQARTALDLAWHIASSEVWFLNGITDQGFTRGESMRPAGIRSVEDVLTWHEMMFVPLWEGTKRMKPALLAAILDLYGTKLPSISILGVMVNHTVHHRGQLAAYLRPMGSKVPSIYGPSADDRGTATAG